MIIKALLFLIGQVLRIRGAQSGSIGKVVFLIKK